MSKFSRSVQKLVANFKGIPESTVDKPLRPVGQIDNLIDDILDKYQINQPKVEESIMAHWRNIIGSEDASRCSPSKILNGKTLVIVSPNPIIRQHLQFERRAVIKRIQRLPGCQSIRELLIRAD